VDCEACGRMIDGPVYWMAPDDNNAGDDWAHLCKECASHRTDRKIRKGN